MYKLQKRGENGRDKGSRGGGGEREAPLPPPFRSFTLAPTIRGAISTPPNLPFLYNQRWWQQQYKHKQTAFACQKYVCIAGYKLVQQNNQCCLY